MELKNFNLEAKALGFETRIKRDSSGYYYAWVPELPGCHTQASSLAKIRALLKDAIRIYLKTRKNENELMLCVAKEIDAQIKRGKMKIVPENKIF
ncbi:MAG: type II toxin-antitoxin system HicB family antitoxin [Candidatus Micrarchaeota archaeon]|nr:type II toxin-antitoxin system HicB family antitoxin [Candidatus Micrarchaeota archaeon]